VDYFLPCLSQYGEFGSFKLKIRLTNFLDAFKVILIAKVEFRTG